MNVENEILTMIALRLDDGERKYGTFTVEPGSRRMLRECVEELADAVVYLLKRCVELDNAEKQIENRQNGPCGAGRCNRGVPGATHKEKGRTGKGGSRGVRKASRGAKTGKGRGE